MTFDDGKCVLKVGSDGLCGTGTIYDATTKTCKVDSDGLCGTGTIYDATTKTCKVDSDGLCGDGTLWEDGKCKNFLNASERSDGEQLIYFSQFCGDTTTAFRGFCESTDSTGIEQKLTEPYNRPVNVSTIDFWENELGVSVNKFWKDKMGENG